MRQYFFWAMAVFIPLGFGLWFLIAVGKSLIGLVRDWYLVKELNELAAESEARRRKKLSDGDARLANGCDHDFETGAFGLPPETCFKCGLQKTRTSGACDHIWRRLPGEVLSSVCEKCGKTYSVAAERRTLA